MNETNYPDFAWRISELHQDAKGDTPGLEFWNKWKVMTPAQKQAEWDRLLQHLDFKVARLAKRVEWFKQGCKSTARQEVNWNADGRL